MKNLNWQNDIEYDENDLAQPNHDTTELDTLNVDSDMDNKVKRIQDDAVEQIIEKLQDENELKDIQQEQLDFQNQLKKMNEQITAYESLMLYRDVIETYGISKSIHKLIDPNNMFKFKSNYLPDTPLHLPESQIVLQYIDISLEGIGDIFKWIWEHIVKLFNFIISVFSRTLKVSLSPSKVYEGDTFEEYIQSILNRPELLTKKKKEKVHQILEFFNNLENQVLPVSELHNGLNILHLSPQQSQTVDTVLHEIVDEYNNNIYTKIMDNQTKAKYTHSPDLQNKLMGPLKIILSKLNIFCKWGVDPQFDQMFINFRTSNSLPTIPITDEFTTWHTNHIQLLLKQNCSKDYTSLCNNLKSEVNILNKTKQNLEKIPNTMSSVQTSKSSEPIVQSNMNMLKQINSALNKTLMIFISLYSQQISKLLNSFKLYQQAILKLEKIKRTD
ncbi:MAG: hypothetical protein LBE13_18625 [Bacteroidales bacterium]|jgi:hypothetical protein|nr:hypothetical protein [Bacteroidales bacterium]